MVTENGREELSCHAVGLVLAEQEVVNSGFDQVTGPLLCYTLFSQLLDMHNTQNMFASVFACLWVYISHRLNYMLWIWNWTKACVSLCVILYECVYSVRVFVQQCHSQIMSVKWSQCLYNGLFNIKRLKESIVLFIELSMKPVQQRQGDSEIVHQIHMSHPAICTDENL